MFDLRLPAAALLAAALAAPAVAQDTTQIDTARGPADVPAAPRSVAVFDLAALDTLEALGVAPTGVTDKLFLDRLAPLAEGAEVVGTLFEPDFEAVNALQPDLVIVGGRSADQYDALSKLSPTVDMTIGTTDMPAQALARLDTYGTLFDKQDEAEAIEAAFQDKLAQARQAVQGQGDALILMTNGPKISAYGPGSRFGWLHDALDLPPAAEGIEVAGHGEAVSFEFVAETDPDWLIVIDRADAIGAEGARAAQTLDNALVAETKAWREGHVIYLNAAEAYITGGGIPSMSNALDKVIEAMGAGA